MVSSMDAPQNSEHHQEDGEHNTAAYHPARNVTVSTKSSRPAATGASTGSRMQTIQKSRSSKSPARKLLLRRAAVSGMARHQLEIYRQLTVLELAPLARLELQWEPLQRARSYMLNVVERDGLVRLLVRVGLVQCRASITHSACHEASSRRDGIALWMRIPFWKGP